MATPARSEVLQALVALAPLAPVVAMTQGIGGPVLDLDRLAVMAYKLAEKTVTVAEEMERGK